VINLAVADWLPANKAISSYKWGCLADDTPNLRFLHPKFRTFVFPDEDDLKRKIVQVEKEFRTSSQSNDRKELCMLCPMLLKQRDECSLLIVKNFLWYVCCNDVSGKDRSHYVRSSDNSSWHSMSPQFTPAAVSAAYSPLRTSITRSAVQALSVVDGQ
jgi:hypothetical protein